MNVLITDLSDETVQELTAQAAENNRSLAAELTVILDKTVEFRRQSRSFDSTDSIRHARDAWFD
jgi:plasmid stability protein